MAQAADLRAGKCQHVTHKTQPLARGGRATSAHSEGMGGDSEDAAL